ncbi:uncharacterized protein LOC128206440 [Mya arenaria]|uniref:uncharacterized protein LOC128206440 n=1 Tax=Mya arenaria TaxID=6604 RepID=UPI0022E198D0|nr:uncharacterized protein LOC128206440 [Mya arenaria]
MQLDVLFRLFGILLCSSCIVEGWFFGKSYADKVNDLFKSHFNNEDNTCWKTAQVKADKSTDGEDEKMAIALINVYTQECKEFNSFKEKSFYAELNEQLRSKTRDTVWLDTENLLNKGLEIIGLEKSPKLYRACHCNDIQKGSTFTVNDFWSTSKVASAANGFLTKEKVFFVITAASRGAYIVDYSAAQWEKEVLLQSKQTFYVKEYVVDKEGIDAKRAGENGVSRDMKAFAVVTGDISSGASKSGSCDCSTSTKSDPLTPASAASMISPFFSALFFTTFILV